MQKKIRVLYLKGCGHCAEYKEGLDKSNISYEPLEADDNSELADSVEDLITVESYPIAIIEEGRETTFVYLTNDGARLGPRRIAANVVAIGCVDVQSMITNTISI
jgi:glutaredoxin